MINELQTSKEKQSHSVGDRIRFENEKQQTEEEIQELQVYVIFCVNDECSRILLALVLPMRDYLSSDTQIVFGIFPTRYTFFQPWALGSTPDYNP